LAPVACWNVELREGKVFVKNKKSISETKQKGGARPAAASPDSIVIIGGGAAGFAAAEKLRRERYAGRIVMLSSETAPPVDRPNLSKDYLAGNAPEDWVPLRPDNFYSDNAIDLRLNTSVTEIDVRSREVVLAAGSRVAYDRLLLTTGAEAIRPSLPGADQSKVHTLRSLADCRAIIEQTKSARRAVILGASFIGLEVAASLRARKIDVQVVAPEKRPMERILGPQMGDFVRSLHEANGVVFHLEDMATAVEGKRVRLKRGGELEADLVVAGVGVRPRTELADKAGLKLDRGVVVDAYLETSAPGIFAAGDIARWPDPHSGAGIRVEHWVVAQRQGQTAALNMLGHREKFIAVPFFWSQHYDVPINYVGHAESWDQLTIDGDIAAKDCLLHYKRKGRVLAVASIFRDIASLAAEQKMEGELAA
jgi:NADPH-dependent 2,4-dienoyl-CoA reductase/sulfur reductase-like enzyme